MLSNLYISIGSIPILFKDFYVDIVISLIIEFMFQCFNFENIFIGVIIMTFLNVLMPAIYGEKEMAIYINLL